MIALIYCYCRKSSDDIINQQLREACSLYCAKENGKDSKLASLEAINAANIYINDSNNSKRDKKIIDSFVSKFKKTTNSSIMLYQKKCGDVKPYIVILTKVDSLLKISSLSVNVKKNPFQNLIEEVAMKLKYKTESITLEDQALREFLEGVDMELDIDGQQEKDNTVSQSMANCNNDPMEMRDFLEGVDMELDIDGQQEKDNTVSQSMANCNNDPMESQRYNYNTSEQDDKRTEEAYDISQSMEHSNMIKNGHDDSVTTTELLEIPFEEIQKLTYWAKLKKELQGIYASEIKCGDKAFVNDIALDTGIYLLQNANNLKNDIHIIHWQEVVPIIDQPAYGQCKQKHTHNFLNTKLLLFPIHGGNHFSVLCFWRLDLLFTTNSPTCILWLDSMNNLHAESNRSWTNLIS